MKKHMIKRDLKRRLLYKKLELKRNLLKSISFDLSVSPEIRTQAFNKLDSFPRDSSAVRIKNRCVLTGRGKAVYSFFKMSRLTFRKLASFGFLPGVTKSSW